MDFYIVIIIIFSLFSIILTEFYLRAIEYANNKTEKAEQDKLKLLIYPIFLLSILAMSIIPDYLPKTEYNIGILTFLPFFNMGAYFMANLKRSISVLHRK